MASLLLKNGYIITVNGSRDVIRNGWIHIEGDSIRGIGPMESFQREPGDRADETIDLHGMIVIPGLDQRAQSSLGEPVQEHRRGTSSRALAGSGYDPLDASAYA